MGQVEDALVVGVGVDGGHRAGADAEQALDDEGHGREAVGRTRGVGHDMVFGRIIVPVVHAHDDGEVFLFGRGGDDHLLGAIVDVDMGLLRGTEDAGGFDHHVHAVGAPVQLVGIAFGEAVDVPFADGGVVAFDHGVEFGASVVGVVFQQVEVGFRVKEIVDGDDLHRVPVFAVQGAEHLPADTPETVDADFDFLHMGIL